MTNDSAPNRRAVIAGIGMGALAIAAPRTALAASASPAAAASPRARLVPASSAWLPVPPQAPATEGMASIPDVKLWYWDTGGSGEPIVLMHPGTGSAAIWGYQQPVLARAGYRVIAYSRRGHFRSEAGPVDRTGTMAGDLLAMADWLKLGRFHLLGSALGGFCCGDFAMSNPDRLLSMTVASSLGGVEEPSYTAISKTLMPRAFREAPPEYRELGPHYRAACPEGTERWKELERTSKPGPFVMSGRINPQTWSNFEKVRTPALVLTGDGDLYQPPEMARIYASHVPGAELAIIGGGTGHSAYWEQPVAFNTTLLSFLKKHRPRGR